MFAKKILLLIFVVTIVITPFGVIVASQESAPLQQVKNQSNFVACPENNNQLLNEAADGCIFGDPYTADLVFVNGIANSSNSHKSSFDRLELMFPDKKVLGIYNAGLSQNFNMMQYSDAKVTLVNFLNLYPTKSVTLIGHSQGGEVITAALAEVSESRRAYVTVYTLGSPALNYPNGIGSKVACRALGDPVGMIADNNGIIPKYFSGTAVVGFVNLGDIWYSVQKLVSISDLNNQTNVTFKRPLMPPNWNGIINNVGIFWYINLFANHDLDHYLDHFVSSCMQTLSIPPEDYCTNYSNMNYGAVALFDGYLCQGDSASYIYDSSVITPGGISVSSAYIPQGTSAKIIGPNYVSMCLNHSFWDFSQDYWPGTSTLIDNSVAGADIFLSDSTCGGQDTNMDGIIDSSGGGGGGSNPTPTPVPSPVNVVTAYDQVGYVGSIFEFPVGDSNDPNNNMVSMKIDSGYKATTFREDNQGGESRCFDTDQPNLTDHGWGFSFQSIRIEAGSCPVEVGTLKAFSQANNGGVLLDEVQAGEISNTINNGTNVFSFDIPDGWSFELFQSDNASGASRCFNTDVANMQDHGDWWHITESIKAHNSDVCPPPPPETHNGLVTNFNGSNVTMTTVDLTWDAYENATEYEISYSYNGAADTPMLIGLSTSYPWAGFYCEYSLVFKIRAHTGTGWTQQSTLSMTAAACPAGYTDPVTGFDYNGLTDSSVNFIWNEQPYATGYNIDYSYDGGVTYTPFSLGLVTSYNGWLGFSCGQSLSFRISANTTSGWTAYTQLDFTAGSCVTPTPVPTATPEPLVAPTNFTYNNLTATSVGFSWDSYPNATGFNLQYSYAGAAYQDFIIGVTNTYNGWAGFSCGQALSFRLSANTAQGWSPYSQIDFTAGSCPNQVPITGFAYVNLTATSVGFTWDAHPHATGYNLQYSYAGSPYQDFILGVMESYNGWAGFSCEQALSFRLSANTSSGWTDYSQLDFTAGDCPPNPTDPITNFDYNSLTCSGVNFTWTGRDGATQYNLRYSYDGGANYTDFIMGVTDTYNGWAGFSAGMNLAFTIQANTPQGWTTIDAGSSVAFTAPACQ